MINYYKKYIKLHNFACKDYFVRYFINVQHKYFWM